MKKSIKLAVLFFTLLIISPVNIHADCQSDFNAIADKFKASYKYNEETDDFTITIINANRGKYAFRYKSREDANNTKYEVKGDKLIATISNYKGTEYYYSISATYDECKRVLVKEETLQLKKYNPYADDPLCSGNEEFVLCQKEYKESIEREDFVSRIETYIETKQEEQGNRTPNNSSNNSSDNNQQNNGTNSDPNTRIKSNVVDDDNVINIVIEFLKDNIIIAIIGVLIIVSLITFAAIKIRKSVKSRRLEW